MSTEKQVDMTRPVWGNHHREYFLQKWKDNDITVLICQRKTKDLIRLTLESLLRFYPDIPVLVVDGDSKDDSTLYLRYKQITTPNVTLWERPHTNAGKHTSHGVTMHEALSRIATKYVLMLDSDVISERGGYIEGMLEQFKVNENLYATGSLMLVSNKNYACGYPESQEDTLRYAHPSCSIINREKYFEIAATQTNLPNGEKVSNVFADHGSPCVYSMMGAEKLGYEVNYYPVDQYTSHLSGASWTEPYRNIWNNDHGVYLRPFVTFIIHGGQAIKPSDQADNDYDVVLTTNRVQAPVIMIGGAPTDVDNCVYPLKYNVIGEYVCMISHFNATIFLPSDIITKVKVSAIELNAPDEIEVDGLRFVKRNVWQQIDCLKND